MLRALLVNRRGVCWAWVGSVSAWDEVREEMLSAAKGATGMGARNLSTEGLGDGHGDVAVVSTLIADDLRERTWEAVEMDSSDDVEGAGDGGEYRLAGVCIGERRMWGTDEMKSFSTCGSPEMVWHVAVVCAVRCIQRRAS